MTESGTRNSFEIIKEPWNLYQISDNSFLRARTILKKIERITNDNKNIFGIDAQTITAVDVDSSLRETPSVKPVSKHELERYVEEDDMNYDTLFQEATQYRLDDGTKIKIFTSITKISRTSLRDARGDPVYNTIFSSGVKIESPDQ